jgi:hypothetical protein
MIGGIAAAVLLGAGATWYFGFRDDGSTTSSTDDGTSATAADAGLEEAETTPTESELSALAALTQAPEPDADMEQAPPPTAEKVDPNKPEEPLPTLIEFEAFGPIEGTTAEQLTEWTELLSELYIDYGGATGRTRKRLRAQAGEIDIIQATPAFLNAIIGTDLADRDGILGVYTMVKDWQIRVASTPTFFFDGDITRTTVEDQNKRVKVVKLWINWWKDYDSGKTNLTDYREKMEKRVKKKTG